MAGYWIFKTEPTDYSWDDLVRDKRTAWSGVKNALAQKHLRTVAKGDQILIYHTGTERRVVGLARAVSAPYPEPGSASGTLATVDIEPVRPAKRSVSLGDIKEDGAFKDLALVRMGRLSVVPVTGKQWGRLMEMVEESRGREVKSRR
ncbi:MAG TPA: EVE domain-containing protein [Gemmatimonadales bacterium]|jgi:predicted RNA-binding protein with PUA-like domain|nr:EVE domain-containing protein [Gemmatimonadales bacterium]